MKELDVPRATHYFSGKKNPGKNSKEDISLTIARQKQKFRTIISIKNVKVFKFLQIKILPCLLFP